jgi:Chemoreceptor zinc-binding domain
MGLFTWLAGVFNEEQQREPIASSNPSARSRISAQASSINTSGQTAATASADPMDEEAEGLNFRTAIEAHQKWKVRLRAVIENNAEEALSVDILSRDDQCPLGKWIHGTGGAKYAEDADFKSLRRGHAYFHVCAGHVLSLAQTGHKEAASAELVGGNFARSSQEVVQDLLQLFSRFRKLDMTQANQSRQREHA